MSNVQVPKFVPERGCYKRRTGSEDCIPALTVYDRVEYISAHSTGGVFTHICSWTVFNEEFEPSNFDYAKVHAMLVRRAARSGATDRAQELLKSLDPARKPPEGEVEMATAKKSPKPVAKKAAPAEAKAAPAKSTKKAAPEAATEKSGPGRKSMFNDGMKITVLAKENPKRAGAAARFALYKNGLTIGEYVAAGGTLADIRWDTKMNYISVK